ncbi:hypothetical protein GCK72_024934 [Caenorhabditis remanei]|uniref:Uncharacterized protein n=1 Tax=Caenorhabditis remanei TaxID=31234 RepID=A0A6A5G0K7_CAERE|nr:hypothetical protein GCK72_024934 [Caenorhabditis remanei]KAF1748467.1 hypothetical protein GCK72_024934 [Caenorhabditis remanei]
MSRIPINLEKPILDFESRQVPVFQEVIENFEEKCCDEHHPQRLQVAQSARNSLKLLRMSWEAKVTTERDQLSVYAQVMGVTVGDVLEQKNNIDYHRFSLILAQWCTKLSHIQKEFQSMHTHESSQLLTLKMPPGSHEVSQNHFRMHFRKAIMAYTVLTSFDRNLPSLTPVVQFFIAQIINESRTYHDPAVYHMVSLFIEHIIREANSLMLQR